jgi:hypothetical protein
VLYEPSVIRDLTSYNVTVRNSISRTTQTQLGTCVSNPELTGPIVRERPTVWTDLYEARLLFLHGPWAAKSDARLHDQSIPVYVTT